MTRTGASILGLAISERAIIAAELGASTAPTVHKTATLKLSAPIKDAASAGAMLRKFLKENGFSAGRVVLGLPAKQIMSRPWQVPPSTPTAAAAILRLAAERQFPPEFKDLIFDYAGNPNPTEPSKVLLLATSKQHVDLAVGMAESAGLSVLGVTSSSLALSAAVKKPERNKILVSLSNESTELVINSDQGPRLLRYLPVESEHLLSANGSAGAAVATLGSELMRASLAGGESTNHDLLLWDALGLRPDSLAALSDRYGMAVSTARDLSLLQVGAPADAKADISVYGPAVALALLARRGSIFPVDFLHSRLAPPKQRRIGRKIYWAIALAVVLAIAIAASVWSLQNQQNKLDKLNESIKNMQPALSAARTLDAKVRTANGWYDNRPATLDCLLHLTEAFPQEGTVWATNISLRDNGVGTVTGKAIDYRDVLSIYDHMKNDPKFSKVVLNNTNMRQGNSKDTVFSISFNFTQ